MTDQSTHGGQEEDVTNAQGAAAVTEEVWRFAADLRNGSTQIYLVGPVWLQPRVTREQKNDLN